MEQATKYKNIIEVALLTSGRPLAVDELQRLFEEQVERSTIRMLLDEIKNDWSKKSLDLVSVANGYRFEANLIFSDSLMRLSPDRVINYSRAVLEVLAIVAYRQPVTRGDIEKIRGVSQNPNTLRQLIEREWVEIIGQKEVPGRPSLYATTKYFLDDFGLESLTQLPDISESENKILTEPINDSSKMNTAKEINDK